MLLVSARKKERKKLHFHYTPFLGNEFQSLHWNLSKSFSFRFLLIFCIKKIFQVLHAIIITHKHKIKKGGEIHPNSFHNFNFLLCLSTTSSFLRQKIIQSSELKYCRTFPEKSSWFFVLNNTHHIVLNRCACIDRVPYFHQ